jgi:SAM-dependent methyltransferase
MTAHSAKVEIPESRFDDSYFSSGGYDTYRDDVLSWVGNAGRLISRLLADTPNPSMLDAGCAHGFLIAVLQERHGMRVSGLEYSPYAIRHAEPAVRKCITRGNLLEPGSFPPNSFDLVSCLDVLEYFDKPGVERAVQNLVRWTKRYVLFAGLYRHSLQASQKRNPDPLRITTLSQEEFKKLFRDAGARCIRKVNFGNGGDAFVFEKIKTAKKF